MNLNEPSWPSCNPGFKRKAEGADLRHCFDMVSSDCCRFLLKRLGLRLFRQAVQEQQRQQFNLSGGGKQSNCLSSKHLAVYLASTNENAYQRAWSIRLPSPLSPLRCSRSPLLQTLWCSSASTAFSAFFCECSGCNSQGCLVCLRFLISRSSDFRCNQFFVLFSRLCAFQRGRASYRF